MNKRRFHAILASAACIAAGTIVSGFLTSSASADYIWTGGDSSGSWSDANNWSTATAPTASALPSNPGGTSSSTIIPAPNTSIDIGTQYASPTSVTYDVSTAVTTSGALEINLGYTLVASTSEGTLALDNGLNSAVTTGVTGGQTGLVNNGTINFTGGTGQTWSIALGGTGAINSVADQSTNSGIIESTGGGKLTLTENGGAAGINNVGGLIQTANNSTLVWNSPSVAGGTITNNSGSTFMGNTSDTQWNFTGVTLNNYGTLSNTLAPGGVGQINWLDVADAGTTISTFTNSGTATFSFAGTGTATTGGVGLGIGGFTAATSTIDIKANGTTDASTLINSGTINIENTSSVAASSTHAEMDLNTTGALTNNGTIAFVTTSSNGEFASINLGQSETIGGTGAITFSGPSNYVATLYSLSSSSHPTLTLGSGQTLSGSVNLGFGPTTSYNPIQIINNGTILANVAANPINIKTYNQNTFTNNGTLAVNNNAQINDEDTVLTFDTGSTFAAQIDSNTNTSGLLNIGSGALVLNGSDDLSVIDVGSTALSSGSFTLIATSGGITGQFANYPQGSLYTIGSNTYAVDYTGNDLELNVTASPEPASCALLSLASLGLLKRRRRARFSR